MNKTKGVNKLDKPGRGRGGQRWIKALCAAAKLKEWGKGCLRFHEPNATQRRSRAEQRSSCRSCHLRGASSTGDARRNRVEKDLAHQNLGSPGYTRLIIFGRRCARERATYEQGKGVQWRRFQARFRLIRLHHQQSKRVPFFWRGKRVSFISFFVSLCFVCLSFLQHSSSKWEWLFIYLVS